LVIRYQYYLLRLVVLDNIDTELPICVIPVRVVK
jgi:hypothetical protein